MRYIKTFESFDLSKYIEEINSFNLVEIDPYEEEEWDELEEGDIIFNIDNFGNINFEKYNGNQDVVLKFSKLNRNNLLKGLLKNRNRQITRAKVKSETIFREINRIKRDFDKTLEEIYKKGEVTPSNKNIILEDVKNGKVSNFYCYYITHNKDGVDKYEAKILLKESDDWWDEVEKYRYETKIHLNQLTYNSNINGVIDSLDVLAYSQLEELVNSEKIYLESPNIKKQLESKFKELKSFNIDNKITDLESIKKELEFIDNSVDIKVKKVESRFPGIKK